MWYGLMKIVPEPNKALVESLKRGLVGCGTCFEKQLLKIIELHRTHTKNLKIFINFIAIQSNLI